MACGAGILLRQVRPVMFDLESEGLEGGAKRKFLSSSSLSSASFWPSPIPLIVLVQFFLSLAFRCCLKLKVAALVLIKKVL